MDFLNSKFIAAIDNLRKEVSTLKQGIDSLRNQQETQQQHDGGEEAGNQQRVPIWVDGDIRTTANKTKAEETNEDARFYTNIWIQLMLVVGTWLAFLTAAVYAGIAWGMWTTAQDSLRDAQQSSKDQLSKLSDQITKLDMANQIAVAANRPWVGTIAPFTQFSTSTQRDDQGRVYVEFEYPWTFLNAGHRPARIESVLDTGAIYKKTCGMNPDYNKVFPNSTQLGVGTAKNPTKAIVLPDNPTEAPVGLPIDSSDWQKIVHRDVLWCMYVKIDYRDVQFPEILHHTRDCRVYYPLFNKVGNCNNEYAHAD